MFLEGLTNLRRSGVVVEVVLFLSERQSTLIDTQDILTGVLLVGTESCTKEVGTTIDGLFQLDGEEGVEGLGCLHLLDDRHHGCHTLLIPAYGIHRELIQVAEFLFDTSLCIAVFQQFGKNTVDTFVVVLLEHVEAPIA